MSEGTRDDWAGTRVAYLGNFSVPYSTESHVAASLESLGVTVHRIQEGETPASDVAPRVEAFEADMFLHTQTYGLAVTAGTLEEREIMVQSIRAAGIPSVAYHLDLWWNLDREDQLRNEPYFRCDHVFTTDNLHDRWTEIGANHHYLPPAVYHAEAYDGTPRREFMSDVAFVGSWRQYGHAEHWPVRKAMLDTLRRRYRKRVKFWPRGKAVRGTDLTDLYASVKVVVGDSCLAGLIPGYWSDRVPETMGRGGLLIHPEVKGILDHHPELVVFPSRDWSYLCGAIDYLLDDEENRLWTQRRQAEHTREHHTYRNRMMTVLATVLGDTES